MLNHKLGNFRVKNFCLYIFLVKMFVLLSTLWVHCYRQIDPVLCNKVFFQMTSNALNNNRILKRKTKNGNVLLCISSPFTKQAAQKKTAIVRFLEFRKIKFSISTTVFESKSHIAATCTLWLRNSILDTSITDNLVSY